MANGLPAAKRPVARVATDVGGAWSAHATKPGRTRKGHPPGRVGQCPRKGWTHPSFCVRVRIVIKCESRISRRMNCRRYGIAPVGAITNSIHRITGPNIAARACGEARASGSWRTTPGMVDAFALPAGETPPPARKRCPPSPRSRPPVPTRARSSSSPLRCRPRHWQAASGASGR